MTKRITRQFIDQKEQRELKRLGKEKVDQGFVDETVKKIVRTIKVPKNRIKKPVIIGMVGLVGSGKRMVAQELAKKLKAVVISNSHIRAKYFRAKKKKYHVYTKPMEIKFKFHF